MRVSVTTETGNEYEKWRLYLPEYPRHTGRPERNRWSREKESERDG